MSIDDILGTLKIEATDARKRILKRVIARGENEFTIEEIFNQKDKKLALSKTVVSNTLRMFVARGLIYESGVRKAPHRGRPQVLMKLTSKFKDT